MGMIINSLLEGEVYDVTPNSGVDSPISYLVNVRMPDGSQSLIPDVIVACLYGGVDDFHQRQLRTTISGGGYVDDMELDEQYRVNTGDRVIVSFLGGSIQRPIIVGYLPHPNRVVIEGDPDNESPQLHTRYLGFDTIIDVDGQVEFAHHGSPTIKAKPKGDDGALASVSSLGASDSLEGPTSDDVEPQETDFICKMNFDQFGSWRVRDSLGQMIEVNAEQECIYISNNSIKSTEAQDITAPEKADSEYIWLDRSEEKLVIGARSLISLHSLADRTDITEGNHSHTVTEDETLTVTGNKTDVVEKDLTSTVSGDATHSFKKNWTVTVEKDQDVTVKGASSLTISDDWTVDTKGKIEISATGSLEITCGATTLTIKPGKFEVVGLGGGVLENIISLIDAITQATFMTVQGPTSTAMNAPAFGMIQQKLKMMLP